MTGAKYNRIRAIAIGLFGIFMLASGALLAFISPYIRISEDKHCTEYVMGEVTSAEDGTIRIYYELPGEGEQWHVTRHGRGWEKGDEVRVFYNPEDPAEKYIESFDEDFPWEDIALGVIGMAIGAGALIVSHAAKKSVQVNAVIDVFDKD